MLTVDLRRVGSCSRTMTRAVARRMRPWHDLGTVAICEVVVKVSTHTDLTFTSFFASWMIFIFDFSSVSPPSQYNSVQVRYHICKMPMNRKSLTLLRRHGTFSVYAAYFKIRRVRCRGHPDLFSNPSIDPALTYARFLMAMARSIGGGIDIFKVRSTSGQTG